MYENFLDCCNQEILRKFGFVISKLVAGSGVQDSLLITKFLEFWTNQFFDVVLIKTGKTQIFSCLLSTIKNVFATLSSFYQILVYTQVYSAGRYIVTASRTGRPNSFSNISQLQVLASQINSQKYWSCCKITPSPVNVGRATAPYIEFGRSEAARI